MKTTMIMRSIANPRRTTLANLEDADDLTDLSTETTRSAQAAQAAGTDPEPELAPQTANPRRTVLVDVPESA